MTNAVIIIPGAVTQRIYFFYQIMVFIIPVSGLISLGICLRSQISCQIIGIGVDISLTIGHGTRKSIFQDITQVIVIKQTIEHDF